MTRSPLDPLSAATPDSRAANALETVDLLAYYGRELSLTLQSAGIFDLTLEGAMALTGAPAALLCAREASGDGWRALRARGLDPRLLPAICRAVPGDFGGKASTLTFVMVAGKPVPVATWYDLRMLLPPDVVPLLSTDRIDRVVSLALEHDGPALLQLFAPNDRVPSPDSLAAVRILLGQTSVALRNARLYFEGSRWAERMAKLQMAGTAIGGTLHVKTVLAAAVRHACDLVEAPAGVLALWNTQTRLLTVQTGQRMAALDTGGTTAHLGEGLAGRAAQERRALARDYAPAAEADASPGAGDPLGAVAAIPLLWQDDLLGVLQVADGNANRVFSDDDLSLLMLLGQQTASAIANARLYERSQARLHQLTVLQDTSRAIIAQLDYDQILRTVLRNVGNLLGTTMGAVFVPNEHEGDLTPRVVVGLQASQLPASATPREDGGLGRVMLAAKPVAVYDALADPSLAPPGEKPPPFRSLLAVPLISQGRVLGALCVYADAPRHWSPAEAELLLVFASQAGNAVQNVLLVDRLRAEKATLATTIESMGDGLVITDAAGDIILANPVADHLFGVPFAGSGGQNFVSLLRATPYPVSYRDGDLPTDLLESVLGQGVLYRGQVDVAGPERMTLEFTFLPVISAGYLITGGLAVFHDITELRRLNDLKTDFISMVSHELRTPLTSIKGFVKLVLVEELGPLTTRQRECLLVADSEADRLTHLINDLLDISRIEAGRMTFTWEDLDTAPLITNVMQMMGPQVGELNLRLAAVLPDDLPPVRGDRQRIAQILTNLVGNAIKFTPPGGRIVLSAALHDDMVSFQVADTGVGIPAHALPHIYDRFYQVDTGGRARGGTGLGLAITRQLVELHGGTLSVASTPGAGSTFTFTLPLATQG